LAGIASRLNNPNHRETFLHFASSVINIELTLHESFLKDALQKYSKNPSPSCLMYTGYLSRQLLFSPVETSLAAVLPCFWIYKEVGDYIVKNQVKDINPYQSWIDKYGGDEFKESVIKAIAICDEFAEKSFFKEEMTDAFLYSSRMEWMFWDSAYRMETWPV
jgi:thiaminase/transcriptional activator TenA